MRAHTKAKNCRIVVLSYCYPHWAIHNAQCIIHNLAKNANRVRSLRRVGAAKVCIVKVDEMIKKFLSY